MKWKTIVKNRGKELHKIDEEISELEGREGEFRQDTYKIGESKKRRAGVLSHLKAHGCQDQSGFNRSRFL